MGFDMTYHPFSVEEIQGLYFAALENPQLIEKIVSDFGVNEFYAERVKELFESAKNIEPEANFNSGHGFYIAVFSGFLRRHHYIRGAAFSFLLENNESLFAKYVSDWKDFFPPAFSHLPYSNYLPANYCAGVFLSPEALRALKEDYNTHSEVRAAMDDLFSHGRLAIFWQVLESALSENLGLIEAAEVVEPNPLDLTETTSYSNLFNCDQAGAQLYQEAAFEQLAAIEEKPHQDSSQEKSPKKGFFSSLFEKK